VGCFGGKVNRAFHLPSGEQVELERSVEAPGLAEGVLVGPTGRWVLPATEPMDRPEELEAIAPWITDGERVLVATPNGLVLREPGGEVHIGGSPTPWRQPALGEGFVAWIEDEVVMLLEDGRGIVEWAPGRHVAAQDRIVAWIDDERVCVQKLGEMKQCTWTDAHTSRALTLDDGVACWESWNGADVDVECSDGFRVGGDGHQRAPSRDNGRVLYRDGETVRVVSVE